MSLLIIGISHRTAPIDVLERVAVDADGARRLAAAALAGEHVNESLVLATCNRVEIYADVNAFHGGLIELGQALSAATGMPLDRLVEYLDVHYGDRAVTHLFSVACGLDSMAVGEGQVLGQLRLALREAQRSGDAGRVLDDLTQRALRVGKRAQSETGIDRAGVSLLRAGLDRAESTLGPLADQRVLVVGAGSMSALAASTVHRAGVVSITVANRTPDHARRLALAVGGCAVPLADLPAALADADLVLSCTGALGHVVDLATARAAAARRVAAGRGPQQYVDLALPRDVAPEAADLPGVHVADLEVLGADLAATPVVAAVERARSLVAEEVTRYLAAVRVQAVAPTVVALRSRAAQVVETELARLDQRLPQLPPAAREELRLTVHRVVEKLLYVPTVRIKELASRQDGDAYAAALREVFDLPADVTAMTAAADVPLDRDLAKLFADLPSQLTAGHQQTGPSRSARTT
jgi:glutamyl-tRNA reductase